MIRLYKDILIALGKLYAESDYIKNCHGLDLHVTLEVGNGIAVKKGSEL
jgi:hypothetical protein